MADDGYRLWLRYSPLPVALAERYRPTFREFAVAGDSATAGIVRKELAAALPALLASPVGEVERIAQDGALVVGTPDASADIERLNWDQNLAAVGAEGFLIRSTVLDGRLATVVAANTDVGALYGTFHLLRLMQIGAPLTSLSPAGRPKLHLRMLNHWDNLDGSIERGYAGRSLWNWSDLPGKLSPRYADYARACASVGINATVLNNVNANPLILSSDYLSKVTALADVFRPYGLRVFLSANFAAPKALGKLPTADPLDPQVAKWWRDKADEIYNLIPDFGGFLVKANSEGQPGPQDYKRTHADGANVLADAIAPHKGVVIWRAFIYDQNVDPDRAKRAYIEFKRLDGQFRPNVAIQVKNGPIDFQPREPFHPLFGALERSTVTAELQVTQEYLGQSKHLVFLAPMWKEFLDSDTFAAGPGSTVARTLDGSVRKLPLTAVAGVANTGSDANWTGHDFAQANWYAFGRLAWDHDLPSEHIADEWIRQTWTHDPKTLETIKRLMLGSWETYVRYTMPLGLHHLIGGDHYAPMPWNAREPRPDWTATYYHQASPDGIGFNRTRSDNGAVDQYFKPVADRFNDPVACPETLLLWFHHLQWDHKFRSGRTLWDELCATYTAGRDEARRMLETWASLATQIDPARHAAVGERLAIQADDAAKWRDACLAYFAGFSGRPAP